MNSFEAYKITKEYQAKSVLSPDEEFMLIEAYMCIINEYKDADPEEEIDGYVAMYNLASLYKRREEYDLALKYFEMCSRSGGSSLADMEIADIYFDGLTGVYDYKKAFNCYSAAAANGFPKAKLRLADMYKNGLYVAQDEEKYRELVFAVYDQIWDSPVSNYKGEVFFKVAKIYFEEGFGDDGFELLLTAQGELEDQMTLYTEKDDLDLMKELIEFQYELMQPVIDDSWEFQLYDLYYILKEPVSIEFSSSSGMHYVSSVREPSGITVELDGKWYRSIADFFYRATVDGERLPAICKDLLDFKIIRPEA